MIRTVLISSVVVTALTMTASVQGQVIQPGADPQPLPGAPPVDSPALRLGQRPRLMVPPAARRPSGPPVARPSTPPGADANRPGPPMLSAFAMSPGLSEPRENVLSDLGYESGKTLPFTPHTTFDLAYKCYADGRYSDAMVFASHGLRMCNDARLHLIKGVCELHRGMGTAAELTAADYRNAVAAQQLFGVDSARERINDAMTLRFADIVEYQATGR
jgi:hypothetical protein